MSTKTSGPVFIGGSPTAGKSFVSKQLGQRYQLPVLEIDNFRVDLRELARKNPTQYPNTFDLIEVTAEEFWKHRTPRDVMQHEINEGIEIWPLVKEKINAGFSGIIEGVSLLPKLLRETYPNLRQAAFIIDRDPERIRKTVYARGVWDDAHTYADWVKELEVQWLPMHAEYFLKEAAQYEFPCIEVTNREKTLMQVEEALSFI